METEEGRRNRIQEAINKWNDKWDKPKLKRLSYAQQRQVKRHYIKWELRRAE